MRRYAGNRRLLLDGLPRLGITELAPADGAFYVYADVGHLSEDTMAFCHDLLARTGVAMAPGIDFDTEVGHRFVRLSFAGPRRPTSRRRSSGSPQPSDRGFAPPPGGPGHDRRGDCMYGDTEAIRGLARTMRGQGDGAALRGRLAAGPRRGGALDGLAADAMRARVRAQVGALRRTAGLADDAAVALDRHADEVDRLKALIAAIERKVMALVAAARDRLAGLVASVLPDPVDELLDRFVPPPPRPPRLAPSTCRGCHDRRPGPGDPRRQRRRRPASRRRTPRCARSPTSSTAPATGCAAWAPTGCG